MDIERHQVTNYMIQLILENLTLVVQLNINYNSKELKGGREV